MSKKYFLSIFILLVSIVNGLGQSGMITGVVVDSTLNETIVGAKAFIENRQAGAYTDLDGTFKIQNLPSGKYTVQISFIGFQTKLYNDVTVKDGF